MRQLQNVLQISQSATLEKCSHQSQCIDRLFLNPMLSLADPVLTGQAKCIYHCCVSGMYVSECVLFAVLCSAVCFCYSCFTLFSTHRRMCTFLAQVTLRLSLGKLTCTYRLFPTVRAEHASRDKPSTLITDYVTVKRTGRGCRWCLRTLSFFLHSYWVLSVSSRSVIQTLLAAVQYGTNMPQLLFKSVQKFDFSLDLLKILQFITQMSFSSSTKQVRLCLIVNVLGG